MPSTYPVYLVDEDASAALEPICLDLGLRCHRFDGADAFLGALDVLPTGVVLLDISMPRFHGFQVLEALRRREDKMPVIAMSAGGGVDIAVRAMKLGAVDFLEKPLIDEELAGALAGAMAAAAADEGR